MNIKTTKAKAKKTTKPVKKFGTVNYSAGDYLIRFKNACLSNHKEFEVRANNLIKNIAQVLKEEGYLEDFSVDGEALISKVAMKNKRPVLMELKLISKPGQRIYMGSREIGKKKGASIYLVSSPNGIISSRKAFKAGVGGEVLAEIT